MKDPSNADLTSRKESSSSLLEPTTHYLSQNLHHEISTIFNKRAAVKREKNLEKLVSIF